MIPKLYPSIDFIFLANLTWFMHKNNLQQNWQVWLNS